MDTSQVFLVLAKMGLVLNILGTVMIALSFGKNLRDAHQLDEKRRKIYLASLLHPKLFNWGLAIIILEKYREKHRGQTYTIDRSDGI